MKLNFIPRRQSALGRLTYGCQPLYLDLNILKWEILQVKNVYNFKYRLRKLRLNDWCLMPTLAYYSYIVVIHNKLSTPCIRSSLNLIDWLLLLNVNFSRISAIIREKIYESIFSSTRPQIVFQHKYSTTTYSTISALRCKFMEFEHFVCLPKPGLGFPTLT